MQNEHHDSGVAEIHGVPATAESLQASTSVLAAIPEAHRLHALAHALCNGADWQPARRAQESGAMEFEMVEVWRWFGGLV